jgi:hypothetical protein
MLPLSPKKRGAVWRIDFKKTGDFLAQIWAVSPFGDFSAKKKKKKPLLDRPMGFDHPNSQNTCKSTGIKRPPKVPKS